jgi:hypothetical protein
VYWQYFEDLDKITGAEPGTGYYKVKWSGDEIKPEMAKIELKKTDKGPAWGAVYWQYFEDLDKITGATTSLQLSKKLFKEENTNEGKKLITISDKTPLQVGDIVKIRIELKTDRNLEYVHMKDMRAAGFEPTKDDLKHFLEELKTDEEFEMTDKEWKKDFQVYKITPDEFDDIMEIIGVPQDAN